MAAPKTPKPAPRKSANPIGAMTKAPKAVTFPNKPYKAPTTKKGK